MPSRLSFNRLQMYCWNLCWEYSYCLRLASVAADGVIDEDICIMSHLTASLRGEYIFVAVVDTNHNTKNVHYQTYVSYSSVVIMGFHIVDCGLYRISGVAWEFWRVKYLAYDLLPLVLASSDTVGKIARLDATEYIGTVAVICVSLYLTCLKIFSVDAKTCVWR